MAITNDDFDRPDPKVGATGPAPGAGPPRPRAAEDIDHMQIDDPVAITLATLWREHLDRLVAGCGKPPEVVEKILRITFYTGFFANISVTCRLVELGAENASVGDEVVAAVLARLDLEARRFFLDSYRGK